VSGCFVTYHKAQIDKLSSAVAEMAIAPTNPNVRLVCLKLSSVFLQVNSMECDCSMRWPVIAYLLIVTSMLLQQIFATNSEPDMLTLNPNFLPTFAHTIISTARHICSRK